MNTQSLRFIPRSGNPAPSRSSVRNPFSPRLELTPAATVRTRFSALPLTRLIDPNLLDRLQSPLTRYHD